MLFRSLSALTTKVPVIFLDPKKIYRSLKEEVPNHHYTLPLDKAIVRREGQDVSLVAYGAMSDITEKAAIMAEDLGISCEVIDLLTLLPFDLETLAASVSKTSRFIVVHEAPQTCGYGAELIATIQEKFFSQLKSPALRVTGFDTPVSYSLEDH